jgi:hypothetical protein
MYIKLLSNCADEILENNALGGTASSLAYARWTKKECDIVAYDTNPKLLSQTHSKTLMANVTEKAIIYHKDSSK